MNQSATQLADDYWTYRRSANRGISLMRGDLVHLEGWDDLTRQAMADRQQRYREFAHHARDAQPTAAGTDLVLLETVEASASMDASTVSTWAPDLQLPSKQVGLVSLLAPALYMQPLVTAEHGEQFVEKLRSFPDMITQLEQRLDDAAREGRVPLARHVQQMIDLLDGVLAKPLDEDDMSSPPPPVEMTDPADQDAWLGEVRQAVETGIRAGLGNFRAKLANVTLPAGRDDDVPGLMHVDGGVDAYAEVVAGYTTLSLAPEEIHQIGLDQMASIEAEYRELAGPLLGTDDLDEIYTRLRDDHSLHHTNAEDIIADSVTALEKATAVMGDWFGRLPQAPCVARPIDVGAMAYYRAPSEDGTNPGMFFFNTSDPSAWAKFQVAAVAYHEGVPGHHLQLALGVENDAVHDLHRNLYLPAYGEGWGLYTERLADEMGLYEDDWERTGMLMADSMRAGRLVVDTGMHALGWTRRQAVDYLVAHSPMAVFEIEEEVDRYIAMPGQALTYMLGRLEINRLRSKAEATLADRFDIKAFHDVVLGNGTVPLGTLGRLVDEWIAA